ncbi:MAG: hypothetical protein DRJ40_10235 [Thermoprotei archaeon]|nr:MAG: hypothetical protein DRJ40_10235 [Thermoprotei archaeon]
MDYQIQHNRILLRSNRSTLSLVLNPLAFRVRTKDGTLTTESDEVAVLAGVEKCFRYGLVLSLVVKVLSNIYPLECPIAVVETDKPHRIYINLLVALDTILYCTALHDQYYTYFTQHSKSRSILVMRKISGKDIYCGETSSLRVLLLLRPSIRSHSIIN